MTAPFPCPNEYPGTTSAPGAEPDRLVAYFGELTDLFTQRVAPSKDSQDRYIELAGVRIQLRFSSPTLTEHLWPALSHRAAAPGDPALTIMLWDEMSSGVPMPRPDWSFDKYVIRGQVRGLSAGHILSALDPNYNGFIIYNQHAHQALYVVPDATRIPYYEGSFPLRTVLSWFFEARGLQVTHSGAVATDEGAALVVGSGGSGKSSTCLTCLLQGLDFLGDDYCLLAPGNQPTVHSLYSSAKLHQEDIRHYPELMSSQRMFPLAPGEKDTYFLAERHADRLRHASPVRAILLPHVNRTGTTTLQRASAREALTAMAPSTLFQIPGAGHDTFRIMAAFARQVPAFHLQLGADRRSVARVISDFLNQREWSA